MTRLTIALTLIALALLSPLAVAHEFWILPTRFHLDMDELVHLRLRLGEPFRGEPVRRDARHIGAFTVTGPHDTRAIVGRDGGDPAGLLRVESPGLHVLAYRSTWTTIEHTPDAFAAYLDEDGLDHIAGASTAALSPDVTVRERYQRCAKSLLVVGDSDASGYDRIIGLPLELVPVNDPHAADGEPREFELRSLDGPCAGALVVAVNEYGPDESLTARTDAAGTVRFDLDAPGTWLISAVHMVPGAAGSESDWQSSWASITFARPQTP